MLSIIGKRISIMNFKKGFLLFTLLFVSVITTACINNFAVQELNNRAKDYLAKGDAQSAIARLKSSLDLDASIFETHYNLGIAYITAEDYENAEKALENAIKIKSDFADSYYSLAVAQEGVAFDKINPKEQSQNDESTVTKTEINTDEGSVTTVVSDKKKNQLSDLDKEFIAKKLNSAISNYTEFLSRMPEAKDKSKVEERINFLNEQLKKYNSNRS